MGRMVESNWIKASRKRLAQWASMAALVAMTAAPALAQQEQQAEAPTVPVNAAPHRQIVVSIPDRQLALLEDGRVLKIYDIAVGADVSPSPTGEFKVINRLTHPTYYHAGQVIPAGKNNPLGTRWMGLSQKGYGIHGTNLPKSIGQRASHGCIRMRRKDLEELFELVRVGDAVVIKGERDQQLIAIFTPAQPVTVAVAGGQ